MTGATLLMKFFILIQFMLACPFVQAKVNPHPLTLTTVQAEKSEVGPGEAQTVVLQWHLAQGYHAYLDQFRLQGALPEGLRAELQDVRPVVEFYDKVSRRQRKGIEGFGQIVAVLTWPKGLGAGPHTAHVELIYQACSAEVCLLPKNIPFEVTAQIKAPPRGADFLAENLEKGDWRIWFLVFLAGILTSFTPCVFPLIPITLTVLSARDHQTTKRAGFLISFAYVCGIAITYALLGLVAASTGALFGSLLGHPAVGIALAVIFFAMGFSLLGWFSIETPAFITRRLATHKTKGGTAGAFFAGTVAGIVASPCVGPILAAILSYVAKTQNLVFGFALLWVYAFGLGQLFLVLGTFSGLRKFLPRSGPWLLSIKYVFGLSFFGLALFYLQSLLPSTWLWRLAGLALLLSTLSPEGVKARLQRLHPLGDASHRWFGHRLGLIAIIGVSLLLFGRPTWLSDRPSPISQSAHSLFWTPYSDEALAQAASEKKAVIVDFFADWCAACKELEELTFSADDVKDLLSSMVRLRFDGTTSSPKFDELQKRYGIVGLPQVILIDATGRWRSDLTLTGFESAADFRKRLEALSEQEPPK